MTHTLDAASLKAAQRYSSRRRLAAGSTSSLRKVAKAFRIAAGERPYPLPERTRKVNGEKQTYHPTKGWRWA